jgi:hypothetical protein
MRSELAELKESLAPVGDAAERLSQLRGRLPGGS